MSIHWLWAINHANAEQINYITTRIFLNGQKQYIHVVFGAKLESLPSSVNNLASMYM